VNARVGDRTIEELATPFAAAAMRLRDRQLVLFNRGDVGLAVRASSANLESFEPVRIGDELYIDGDEASPVPIRAARRLGAKCVIAVDVSAYLSTTPRGAPREWVEKDERRARMIAAEAPAADVFLHPNIGYYAGHNDEYRRRVIAIAEDYTRSALPRIRAAIPSGVASR
jgi:NTE family protein